MARSGTIKIKLTEDKILKHLDNLIRAWRFVRRNSSGDEGQAIHYIDAYQSMRVSIFGERLEGDDQ